MSTVKRILITGSTDGIGLETARALLGLGHRILLHGRNPEKLRDVTRDLEAAGHGGRLQPYLADLSSRSEVERLAGKVARPAAGLEVLINNAGVFSAPVKVTEEGLDVRFAVNTIAPFLLVQLLLPTLAGEGRVVNLSSAAQAPVDPAALRGQVRLPDGAAYAQSKLALTAWSRALGLERGGSPSVVSVNPGSLLGTKMVMEARMSRTL